MADYLLDTNILKYWYDTTCAEHPAVIARVTSGSKALPLSFRQVFAAD